MNQPKGELKRIALADIVPSASNPRKHFETPDWPDFVDNIRQRGVLQPGVGRPHPVKKGKIELVAGERRYRASTAAKLEEMPLMIMDLTDADVIEIQQIENLQREGLSALEEAQGYADWRDSLIKAGTVKTVEEAVAHICTKINRKRSAVFQRLALLKICPVVKKALLAGDLDPSKAALISQIPDPKKQEECLDEALDEWDPMSVRQLSEHIAREYRTPLSKATFKIDKAFPASKQVNYHPDPCGKCPFNTTNLVDQFPEAAKTPNVCTNPSCFRTKTTLHTERVLEQARAAGKPVIPAEDYQKQRYSYEKVDDKCYYDDKSRTYGQLAKIAGVEPKITVNDEGAVVEVFTKPDVAKIKAANKIRESSGGSGGGDDYSRKKAKRKKENLPIVHAAIGVLVKKLIVGDLDDHFWELMAKAAQDQAGINRHDFVAKRRGLSKSCHESRPALDKFLKSNLTAKELMVFTFELLVLADALNWDATISNDFKRLCKLGGINLDTIKPAVPAPQPKTPHIWEKTDLISGATTNYRCKSCGVKGVRMGITWPPRVAKKDEFCRAVTSNTPPQAIKKTTVKPTKKGK